jgi:enamine deaminase RidA (YjgF/YER057c/UK114 family)
MPGVDRMPSTNPISAEQRLRELNLTLPDPAPAQGLYEDALRDGDLVYLSGKGPRRADGTRRSGKVGADVSLEEAIEDARIAGLNLLAALRREIGSLDRVERVVKVLGMVNGAPGFSDHPKVIDGCSRLMIDVFGEKGRHARSAVGMGGLPGNMTVEIEMIVRVAP